jgi:hypothetical protein
MATDSKPTRLVPEQDTLRQQPGSVLLLIMAALAGLAWAAALAMLFFGDIHRVREPLATPRIIFCLLAFAAGMLTFVPLQQRLRIPGLALSGTAGSFLTLYCLAFVPAPTEWLLSPPDAPVYIIFAAALYWLVSSVALPIAFAFGQRMFRQRARQYDLRRARRQSREAGAAVVLCLLLAGLRILTPLGVILVILIVVVSEFLFLAFVKAEG